MNPEILARQMYLRSRISLREFMMLSNKLIRQMYLTARISLPEFNALMRLMEGRAKAKKRSVRRRAKTDDKQAGTAQ